MSVNLELEAGSQFGLEVHSQLPGVLLYWADEFLGRTRTFAKESCWTSLASLGDLPLPP